ncbi:MAG: Ig-like domain-containing protein [Taibaiella sp.]|nr:Ig-like domain-containing protein [Taibaiella sp.]
MNQTIKVAATVVVLAFSSLNALSQQKSGGGNIPSSIERNEIDGTPVSITFPEIGKYRAGQGKGIIEQHFGKDQGVRFDLLKTTNTKQGTIIEKYQEYIDNFKVEGATYAIIYDRAGNASFLNGNAYHTVAITSGRTPTLKEEAGRELAIKAVGAELYAWQEPGMEKLLKEQTKNGNATHFPKGDLVWVEDQSEGSKPRTLRLAYRYTVYALKPLSNDNIYVDAETGKALYRNSLLHHTDGSGPSLYSGTVSFKTTISGGTRYMWDSTRGGGIKTYNMAGSTSSGSLISSATSVFPSDVSIDAHWGATQVYDYWLNEQGRDSYDDAGAGINSFVHYSTNYNNAFWDGYEMIYGDGSGLPGGFLPLAALDVCAHEIGHAVCQYTADLAYNRESGAMNEGFSDIWGAVIENYADPHESDAKAKNKWEIGEEIAATPLRRMNTPNTKSQPDTYGGTYWVNVTTTACPTPSSGNDYCGVHTNSGVLNHWFYVLSDGETGTNDLSNSYAVTGIGISKAADIAYQTELLLSSSSTYSNARSASISAATTLYGGCSAEVAEVTRAWYAVGVGANWSATGAPATTGTNTVCVSSTTTLSNASTGGTWSSSNTSIATVGTSGVVTGVGVGTVLISYQTGGGCTVSSTLTVSTLPTVSATSGTTSMCQSASVSLTNATSGGTWSSSNTSVATVGTSGTVTGGAAGTAKISYTVTNACGSTAATTNVTVFATPSAIGGTATVCQSSTTTLTNSISSGTWTSGTTAVATVNATSGVVTGISGGTSVVTYTLPGTCFTTKTVTVNSLPTVNAITGGTTVCQGATITLANSTSGGSWSSANASIASVNSSGVVSGVAMGTTTISYTVTNSCGSIQATTNITVSPATDPGTITGASTLCVGDHVSLSNAVTGGTWSTSNSAIATIGSTGSVLGVAAGTVTISYQVSTACGTATATKLLTVNALPNAGTITGGTTVCVGGTITLSNAASGGTWSSSATGVATVGSTGIVTGASSGTANIFYTVTTTCGTDVASKLITVSSVLDPGVITGGSALCAGSTLTLSNTVTGGTWSSSATAVATVATSGVVLGVTAGTATISYVVNNGCGSAVATQSLTVNPAPNAGAITGGSTVCAGSTRSLSNSVSGGSWSSSNASVATVGTSGVVSGVAGGNVTISYTVTNGCGAVSATKAITVNPLPNAGSISGRDTVEIDSAITLTSSAPSGTWSSSTPAVATVNSGGIVAGLTEGTTTISYTVSNSCGSAVSTKVVTVVTVAPCVVLSGPTAVCIGYNITLSASVGGGTWTSGSTSVATVGSASGVVTGVSNGTSNITYSLAGGCTAIMQVTVGLPPIVGTTNVCIGTTTALTHPSSGGTWSMASPYIATVDSVTGVVTGVHVGPTTVTYTTSPGCYVTAGIYVANISLSVAGTLTACEGGTSTVYVPGYPGGWWSSDSTTIATINGTTGVMTGVSAGTTILTYTYAYCYTTTTATVSPVPAAISGSGVVCEGATLSLACSTAGGVWSSSNTARATVDASGLVTAVGAGTVTIYYTLGSGCAAAKVITVGAMPAAITGVLSVCAGSTTTLSCATTGGTWSSSATGIASVIATAGYSATISGVAPGVATISYNHSGGCVQTTSVTVDATPGAISGTLGICVGGSTTLTGSGTGTWSSSNISVASIGSATGVLTGAATGNATITYRTGATCYTTAEVTVGVPATISGAASVCKGYTTVFMHSSAGGAWTSSNSSVASVDASGTVSGVNAGSAFITYTIASGCFAVKSIYVYNNPAAISGVSAICAGGNTSLSSTTSGAVTWATSDTSIATVSASGMVSGVAAGTINITFTATATGCFVTKAMTINETPSSIAGSSTVCVGADQLFTSTPSGGAWSSTSPAVGSINATTGIATGRTGGGTYIKYTLSTGCYVLKPVTVTAVPAVSPATGVVCVGNSITFSGSAGVSWASSAPGTALISSSTATAATVSGVSMGVASISYFNAAGCARVAVVTVNAAVADIVGDDVICSTGTMTLTDATTGGTWSSNATTKVSVATYTGLATGGGTLGTAIITYKASAGCYATKSITNNAALPNITGATFTCSGEAGAVTFTNSFGGGTWSSSNSSVAVVGSSTGVVTGMLMGGTNTYVNIIYATSAGCSKSKSILIKPVPVITGADEVIVGSTATMTGSPTGGSWGSSSIATATISGYGVVAGIAPGSAIISYTAAGCLNTKSITVTGASARPTIGGEVETVLFSIFPNPSHGSLSVSAPVDGVFAIFTVDGKLITNSELTEGVTAIQLPAIMAPGTYVCRFTGSDGTTRMVTLSYQP